MSSSRKRGAIQKAQNEVDKLRQSLILANYHGAMMKGVAEVLAKDAGRYRWLRENNIVANVQFHFANGESSYLYAEALDEAIDNALERLKNTDIDMDT